MWFLAISRETSSAPSDLLRRLPHPDQAYASHSDEALVRPGPVANVRMLGRNRLQTNQLAQRARAERGHIVEIRDAVEVSGPSALVPGFAPICNVRSRPPQRSSFRLPAAIDLPVLISGREP
jgi:hypothetical protein